MWATHSGGVGGKGEGLVFFFFVVLFLFCDDVRDSPGMCVTEQDRGGEGREGGKFNSVPDVIGQDWGKGACRSMGGKGDPTLKGPVAVMPFQHHAPNHGWASPLIHFQ